MGWVSWRRLLAADRWRFPTNYCEDCRRLGSWQGEKLRPQGKDVVRGVQNGKSRGKANAGLFSFEQSSARCLQFREGAGLFCPSSTSSIRCAICIVARPKSATMPVSNPAAAQVGCLRTISSSSARSLWLSGAVSSRRGRKSGPSRLSRSERRKRAVLLGSHRSWKLHEGRIGGQQDQSRL